MNQRDRARRFLSQIGESPSGDTREETMRISQCLSCGVALVLTTLGCGYGKDTGPTTPKSQAQFEPLVEQFVTRSQSCFDDVFKVNMGRAISVEEQGAKDKVNKAMSQLRAELLGCMTGKGYGNEVQLDASLVQGWLAKSGCLEFAQAAYKAPQCIAIQSVVEEAGFSAEAAAPPRQPPSKKRGGH